jgi:hypothetical protein
MSQLQVTGEAKIRDIQGPVVANSGVITALDGAASQYVRGDGTLADFPTSSGGGSSVSYYLNSSVSQGTIGGVAYRELSKEPIIGAGTDIAISTTGYVASYITDANDPDVLSIPGGNFNCEFYFSVNNNTGNPFFYAELYKYDGTTFTLLGSSVGVPEYINQGTIIAPYYFAIPVATAALALTDRLAIRIYVNVDGRTVTLHTENGHLCQVVTTFSKGLTSLNNLTRQVQFFGTGTSGTDFNISSSTATHTFNLPIASATNTGKLSSSDWSVFNAKQAALSFTAPLVNTSNTISIPAATSLVDGYLDNADWTNFNTAYNNMIVSAAVTGTTTKTLTLTQQDAGTITASWTDDNTDAVTSVFGRTGAVVAVSGDYNTSQVTELTNLYFTDARSRAALSFTAGSGAYNSTTGVITIPTNTNQLTNGASFITLSSLSAGTGISYNNTTGVITNSAPDQTVSLTAGAGISISGSYPSFTIASTITQYTDALARAALSFTAGSGAYNSTTGVITIPTNNNQITNGSNFITLTSLSAGAGISYNNTTGAISSTITQYTDALARAAISLTTTGSSGAATYNSTTGVFNIPNYGSALSGYLPLTGGTLTGALNISNDRTAAPIPFKVDNNLGYGIYLSADNALNFNYSRNETSTGYINYRGYNDGATQFRNLVIADGKNATIAEFTASSKLTTLYGSLLIGYIVDAGFKLDVSGTARVSNFLEIKNNASNISYLTFQRNSNTQAFSLIEGNGENTTGWLKFYTSDTVRLTIAGNGAATFNLGSGEMRLNRTGTSEYLKANTYYLLTNGNDQYLGSETAGVNIYAGGSPRLNITSGGNVGIGVIPSAWGSGYTGFQVGAAGSQMAVSNNNRIGLNFYFDGSSFRAIQTGAASLIEFDADNILFKNASSVSGGSAQSITERMKITSAGLVRIGPVTDTDGTLQVRGWSQNTYAPTGYNGTGANLRLLPSSTGGTNITTGISLGIGGAAEAYIGAVQQSNSFADIVFQTYNGSGYGERMRITSGGNVLMNTTTSSTSGGFTNTTLLVKQVADGGGGGGLQIEQNSTDNVAFFGFSGSAFRIGTSYRFAGSYQPILISAGGSGNQLYLNTTGNVLVNTTTDNGQGKLQVNGAITANNISYTGELVTTSTTFNATYYHIISGAVGSGQTYTLPSPSSNNLQYVVINKSNFSQTISAGSGFTIYNMAGSDVGSITLASKARCFIIADGSGFYQIF